MARTLGADSLRYLPVESIARATGLDVNQLCQGCITGSYPTEWGQQLYQIAQSSGGSSGQRTYEAVSNTIRS